MRVNGPHYREAAEYGCWPRFNFGISGLAEQDGAFGSIIESFNARTLLPCL
jgi:hypothetical protein